MKKRCDAGTGCCSVRKVGGEFGRWCAKHMKARTGVEEARAQHELQMLKLQQGTVGRVQLAETTLLYYMDVLGQQWAVIVMRWAAPNSVLHRKRHLAQLSLMPLVQAGSRIAEGVLGVPFWQF